MHSNKLFVDFQLNRLDADGVSVRARTPTEAIYRAKKRGYGVKYVCGSSRGTTEDWASWVVKLENKNTHWRNLKFY